MIWIIVPLVILALPITVVILQVATILPLLIQARSSGADVTMWDLIGTRLRQLDPRRITETLILARQAGLDVNFRQLEAHALAGGNLAATVAGAVSAHKAGLGMSFAELAAIDLAGRDVAYAVDAAVRPKVLLSEGISGVTRDGIRIGAKVRVTVRANLRRLVGGAGVDTIIARVGEGTVAAIGRADNHKHILENPAEISRFILQNGLDAGTAFEIVSVDVADLDVLDNVGARLTEVQARSDTLVAQARAEMRRAAAVATEQEMCARTAGMAVRETLALADIPTAMAAATAQGRLWRRAAPLPSPFRPCLWKPST